MILHVLRALFILLMAAAAWFYLQFLPQFPGSNWVWPFITLGLAVLFITTDVVAPRRKLAIFSGTFLGLIVGITIAYALSFVIRLLVETYYQPAGNLTAVQLK